MFRNIFIFLFLVGIVSSSLVMSAIPNSFETNASIECVDDCSNEESCPTDNHCCFANLNSFLYLTSPFKFSDIYINISYKDQYLSFASLYQSRFISPELQPPRFS